MMLIIIAVLAFGAWISYLVVSLVIISNVTEVIDNVRKTVGK